MKRKIVYILLTLMFVISFSMNIFAEGDPNADGGGGGMGSGTSSNSWSSGMEGVRVSIVEVATGEVIGIPIDYTNKSPANNILFFGYKSKIQYRNGSSLAPSFGGAYRYKNPSPVIPKIISSGGSSNIEAVKRYFCTDGAARMIADDFGITFENLTSGRYKLLIEPIAYFKFEGNQVGMTAHEAALYDQILSGGLRSKMSSLSHQNLPLAIFLERSDLGFPAYSGSTSTRQSNDTIKSSLGMGIVSYTETPIEPEILTYDYEYRVNTDVITAVTVTGGQSDPDNPTTVRFNINGIIYTVSNVYYPDGDSQLACTYEDILLP